MPSKRSHGEGTLRHRSDGRWELRMMDGYQKDGSPRFKTFYGKTQKEVKLKLKEYQDALISGVQLDTILYFEDWADTWFEGHKDNIAPTTQESYKYCLKMLKEGFYHRPLTVIRPIDIENFLKGMRRDGRSDSYISKARGMLYQIFQKAEANDLVRRNPVRLAEKMRASGTAKRKEAFTTAEVAHLMKVLPDDRMGLSIRLLLGTGMRMQELLALEPQYIEEDGSVIHIRQAVKVVKGTVSIGSPKSKDSIRDHLLELRAVVCFGRERTVNVVLDDRNAVLFGIRRAFSNLTFDGFFTLVVGRVTSIDNSSHNVSPPFAFQKPYFTKFVSDISPGHHSESNLHTPVGHCR